ncbi:unnamed protein product [Sphagnum jensenii]|uniref:FAD/NAD(P)-binding domain-containing protein n=1 Tax=Sphagnum jensenii TaxID=128206 RepID=A0ABP0V5S5_9BRYO
MALYAQRRSSWRRVRRRCGCRRPGRRSSEEEGIRRWKRPLSFVALRTQSLSFIGATASGPPKCGELFAVLKMLIYSPAKVMLQRARTHPKIRLLLNTTVVSWLGKSHLLSGALLRTNGSEDYVVVLDESGYVRLTNHSMTSTPGVFACGDCADRRYKPSARDAGHAGRGTPGRTVAPARTHPAA